MLTKFQGKLITNNIVAVSIVDSKFKFYSRKMQDVTFLINSLNFNGVSMECLDNNSGIVDKTFILTNVSSY